MLSTSGRARILVVDDDPNARSALAEILGDEGYDVRTAGDGLTALAMVRDFLPDVLITDVRMPNLDGLGLARSVESASQVPSVIFMSASWPRPPEGAAVLYKPIDVNRLLAAVDETLRH
jgi:DNA-binding response OmpR family regulator